MHLKTRRFAEKSIVSYTRELLTFAIKNLGLFTKRYSSFEVCVRYRTVILQCQS